MLLTLTLALLPQTADVPTAPFGLPQGSYNAPQPFQQGSGGPAIVEDFETYVVPAGSAENILSLTLDSTTVTGTGQGPGLVLPGVFFQANSNSLQWNGDGYFGLTTQTFMANGTDGTLYCGFATPQPDFNVNLHAFSGFPDTAVVNCYDTTGTLVATSGPVNVPGPTAVPVALVGPDIQRVTITGTYSWSPIIDDMDFDTGSSCGLQLSITGPCPGTVTVTVNGGVPFTPCVVAYAWGTGSYVVPSGPCAGTVLGLDSSATPVTGSPFFFNASGQVIFTAFVPAGACGNVWVQAVSAVGCCTSNVVGV